MHTHVLNEAGFLYRTIFQEKYDKYAFLHAFKSRGLVEFVQLSIEAELFHHGLMNCRQETTLAFLDCMCSVLQRSPQDGEVGGILEFHMNIHCHTIQDVTVFAITYCHSLCVYSSGEPRIFGMRGQGECRVMGS